MSESPWEWREGLPEVHWWEGLTPLCAKVEQRVDGFQTTIVFDDEGRRRAMTPPLRANLESAISDVIYFALPVIPAAFYYHQSSSLECARVGRCG